MQEQEIEVKNLDHLGLVAGMIDELGIVRIIDQLIPKDESKGAKLSFGELTKAMILNGLGYVNKQLYMVKDFFKDKPLKQLFNKEDISWQYFNDDSLGRTLDKLYEYGVTNIFEKIAKNTVDTLNIKVDALNIDSTSFHVDGEYKNSELLSEDESGVAVRLKKGYSRDYHPELKQVVLNLIVENSSGIPLVLKVADGNQIDTQGFNEIVKKHIESLKNNYNDKFLLIGDASLYVEDSIQSLHNQNLLFITRVPVKFKEAKELLKELKDEELTTIDENYSYKSVVLKHFGINAKWVVYKSNLSNKKEVGTLNKVLLKNSSNELKEANRLKKRTFYCTEDAVSSYNKLKQDSKFIKLTEYKIIQKPKFQSKGRPKKDEKPVSFEYYLDYYTYMDIDTTQEQRNLKCGYFILATNDLTISAKELLDEYKTQQRVERGFRFLKSPEFLSDAIFLKTESRIEAMLMIMTLCLLVYVSLEYKIRQELKQRNLTIPNQLNKEVQNPTTRWIFQIFFAIHIVTVAKTFQQVVGINELHLKILNLLGDRYKRFYGIDGGARSEKNIKSGAE